MIKDKPNTLSRNQFAFSVVMTVCNEEPFIDSAIKSIAEQTIGFERHIQLIIVDNINADKTCDIAVRYMNRYPDNICYIKREQDGISNARNEGMKHIRGKYTVFFDGSDEWEADAFAKAFRFFEDHYNEIDVCNARLDYSGGFSDKKQPFEYKFEGDDCIVNLNESPNMLCTTIGNCIFKSDAIINHQFSIKSDYYAESLFLNRIILETMNIGIVSSAVIYCRENRDIDHLLSGIIRRSEWYFDIPNDYYLALLHYAHEKYHQVPRYCQELIFYDIKRRAYDEQAVSGFTTEQKNKHIELIEEALSYIDDEVIIQAKNVNLYKRILFLNMKHQKDMVREMSLSGKWLCLDQKKAVNLHNKSLFSIEALTIADGEVSIQGIQKFDVLGRAFDVYAKDNKGSKYIPALKEYKEADVNDLVGNVISEGFMFEYHVPISPGIRIGFFINHDGQEIKLKPSFGDFVGLSNDRLSSFWLNKGYIVKYIGRELRFYSDTSKTFYASAARLFREIYKKQGRQTALDQLKKDLHKRRIAKSKIKERVAFISIRSDDKLLSNMENVYNEIDLPKQYYAKKRMEQCPDLMRKAEALASSSRIVVVDDYCAVFRDNEKKIGQRYVQLWHATGAGKKFGQDGTNLFPPVDAMYHRDYDLVTVSSEHVRSVFSSAFDIPIDRIKATGVARTDCFFDENYAENAKSLAFEKHDILRNKQVIIYVPTFRDIAGVGRASFSPDLDFDLLAEKLGENQMFVVCPHPLMTEPILKKSYDNIIEIRDVSTNDMMFVSDLMITDYSSVMFEYSLLKKPMAFFCYDYDTYDRDFYMDFDKELPGKILRTQEELFDYLEKGEYTLMDDYDAFYDKYMSACDGHSTGRIAKLIKDYYYED